MYYLDGGRLHGKDEKKDEKERTKKEANVGKGQGHVSSL